MKIRINTEIIKSMEPCKDRYENWLANYKNFDAYILEFLELKNITATDKIWVSIRVMPRFLVEVFAIDCAFSAAKAAYAANAAAFAATYAANAANADADAAYAATYAANAAAYAAAYAYVDDAAYAVEQENQVDALIMLIKREVKNEYTSDKIK